MVFASNGQPNPNFDMGMADGPGGAAVEIDNSNVISICGNHFDGNDNPLSPAVGYYRAHIRFGGVAVSDSVSLCGDVYHPDTQKSGPVVPDYVYDVLSGVTPTHSSLFEAPGPQNVAIFSPGAVSAFLPQQQAVTGVATNYITGLILSNDASHPANKIDITSGEAADSTNSFLLQSPASGCTVNSTLTGPGGLDSTTSIAGETLFFFLIGGQNVSTACIASLMTSPSFLLAAGYSSYRMIGALYADSSSNIVQFVQNDDTFYLNQSVPFSATLGSTSPTTVALTSVPNLISVEALGRCSGSSAVLLMGGNAPAGQTPSGTFTTSPGYMVNVATPATAYPFELYTRPTTSSGPAAPGGNLIGKSSSPSTSLTCYDDGWIWHRGK